MVECGIQENYQQLVDETGRLTRKLLRKFHPHFNMPESDLAWDCFTTLYMRGFYHKYDRTKSSEFTYLYNGVKNFLIDKERCTRKVDIYSLDDEVSSKGNLKFADMVDSEVFGEARKFESYVELIGILKKDGVIDEKYKFEGLPLSVYSIMYLKLKGYNGQELAEIYHTSTQVIRELYATAVSTLQKAYSEHGVLEEDSAILYDKAEYGVACNRCGSDNIKPWGVGPSGVHYYYCKDCNDGIGFTLFSGTPLNYWRFDKRKKFVDFVFEYNSGVSLGDCARKCEISFEIALEWVRIIQEFHKKEGRSVFSQRLKLWDSEVNKVLR